jgi:hypothetical protein
MKKSFLVLSAAAALLLSACSGSSGSLPETGKSELEIAQALVAAGFECTADENTSTGITGLDMKQWDCDGPQGYTYTAAIFSGEALPDFTRERVCQDFKASDNPFRTDVPQLDGYDFAMFVSSPEAMATPGTSPDAMETAKLIDAVTAPLEALGQSLGIPVKTASELCG